MADNNDYEIDHGGDSLAGERRDQAGTTDDIDLVQLFRRIKSWHQQDASKRSKWLKEAEKDFAFVAGDQFTEEEESALIDSGRQPIVFNRCLTVVKSIAGSEINGRLDTRFLPRGVEDSQVNELLSAASEWMADQCDAEDEQSEAFESALICGMGWTEGRISFDENPEGMYEETELDPREMYWDCKARKKNLSDSRRRSRLRTISIVDARQMFPDISDEDLDANWATDLGKKDGETRAVEDKLHQGDDLNDVVAAEKTDVSVLQIQWWEKEPYYVVAVAPPPTPEPQQLPAPQMDPQMAPPAPQQPQPGGQPAPQPPQAPQQPPEPPEPKIEKLSVDEFKEFKERAEMLGIEFQAAKLMRKRYKQAFVGGKVLEVTDAPFPEGFTFNCITGERDRKNNSFFGIVSVMRDPQLWANKMLINALHIANTTAKGGILAEEDVFEDQRDAEATYAMPHHITEVTRDSIKDGRIIPKPGGGDVSVYIKILEFAISSIRDVTGVNMELLGLRDANQPGILEAQRKQAAMTVLASLFNSLRRFRKDVGRYRLHVIQEYMSDGRLIRIKGEHGGDVKPLNRDDTLGDYDVIVADAPTSPNQKEETWQLITQIMPVVKEFLTPEVMLALLEYSPFPVEIVEKMRELYLQSQQQSQQGQEEEAQRSMQLFNAELRKILAGAGKDEATAAKTMAEAQVVGQEQPEMDDGKAQLNAAAAQAKLIEAAAKASATEQGGEAKLMQALAAAAATKQKSQSDAAMNEAQVKKIMADTMKQMTEVIDQRMQTALALRKQEHDESMSERALRNTENDLED